MSPTTTRDAAKERTRVLVLHHADACFRELGFDAATIKIIAERAGVSVGSVMSVGDKQALLVASFDRAIAERHDQQATDLQAIGAENDTEDLAERLAALVTPFITLFATDPVLSRRYAAILVSGAHESELFKSLATTLKLTFASVLHANNVVSAAAQNPLTPRPNRAATPPASSRATQLADALYYAYLGVLFSATGSKSDATGSELAGQLAADVARVFRAILETNGAGQ